MKDKKVLSTSDLFSILKEKYERCLLAAVQSRSMLSFSFITVKAKAFHKSLPLTLRIDLICLKNCSCVISTLKWKSLLCATWKRDIIIEETKILRLKIDFIFFHAILKEYFLTCSIAILKCSTPSESTIFLLLLAACFEEENQLFLGTLFSRKRSCNPIIFKAFEFNQF